MTVILVKVLRNQVAERSTSAEHSLDWIHTNGHTNEQYGKQRKVSITMSRKYIDHDVNLIANLINGRYKQDLSNWENSASSMIIK